MRKRFERVTLLNLYASYKGFSLAVQPIGAWRFWLAVVLVIGGVLLGFSRAPVWAQEGPDTDESETQPTPSAETWTRPVLLSTNTESSWFSDVAVDALGRVHVVWDSAYNDNNVVMYSRREGDTWTEPHDVAGPYVASHISRASVAVDLAGRVHILYDGTGYALHHSMAETQQAQRAAAWQQSFALSNLSYISDIEIDQEGVIHAVYDTWVRTGATEEEQTSDEFPEYMSDVFYRRSADGGRTWSGAIHLFSSPRVGSARAQLEIDRRGTLHVAWDEGWDRWSLYGDPEYGVYMNSQDGGLNWSEPLTLSHPARTNAQLTVGADGQGGTLLVWRATDHQELFYNWSADDGLTWTEPTTISTFFARPWTTPFDAYDMEADSAGRIHLVAVGQSRLPAGPTDAVPLGVYHLVWDGRAWSEPQPIAVYPQDRFPEYPKLDVSQGNQLHVTWFVRDDLWQLGNYQIWYSQAQVDAPYEAPPPTPTPIPMPTATPAPTSVPTATPVSLRVSPAPLDPSPLSTENDEVLQLLIAIAPFLALVAALFGLRRLWIRRL